MSLLTESMLYFLNLTSSLNATTEKFALGGRVISWVSDVKPAKSEPISRPSSISTRAPPTSIFSQGTASTAATSDVPVPIRKPVTEIPEALGDIFADDIDDTLERDATIAQGKGKLKVASIFKDNSDFDEPKAPFTPSDDDSVILVTEPEQYSQEPKAPFTQMDNHRALKCEASMDDVSDNDTGSMMTSWSIDMEGPDLEDPIVDSDDKPEPEPVVVKQKVLRTTSSTSVSIATSVPDSKPPAPKKAKSNVDTVPSHMKSHSAYRNVDLPATMQVDQRWTKKYLPTIMLWAGSYDDIWTIPDKVLLLHAQLIFNAVYRELKITLVHGSMIHCLTAQRISEWRSNFGSTGIVIILDSLTRNSDCDPVELSKSLIADYAFLFEDPDKPSPLTAYCSPFILQLLGTAHINAINGYVEVPELDTHVFVTHGMSRVIAVSAAAIEHALTMFTKNDLKVKQVLASTSKGKLGIKLLKVLNKTTGKMTNAPFLFSVARWAKVTASFIKSLSNKPPVYVEATVQMAHACTALNDTTDMPQSLLDNEESDDDECAMLFVVSA
ncbi:hypothetical protein F4604DRAFT_1919429 [Suillus subluteus]|nr:hypothetical protein F4604DRAFT_1919429 [Suillus subluteus]